VKSARKTEINNGARDTCPKSRRNGGRNIGQREISCGVDGLHQRGKGSDSSLDLKNPDARKQEWRV